MDPPTHTFLGPCSFISLQITVLNALVWLEVSLKPVISHQMKLTLFSLTLKAIYNLTQTFSAIFVIHLLYPPCSVGEEWFACYFQNQDFIFPPSCSSPPTPRNPPSYSNITKSMFCVVFF